MPQTLSDAARAALIVIALVTSSACSTEQVELLPDARATSDASGADGTRPDVADGADAATTDDAARDTVASDVSVDSVASCVCRFVACRGNAECTAAIGASSTCANPGDLSCSGAAGICRGDNDCNGGAPGWSCTAGATTLTPCP